MPTCPQCGHKFVCTEHSDKVGKSVQDCPLKKGALWAQVQHDGKQEVEGVFVRVDNAIRKTDELGYAPFDPLPEATYLVSLEPLQGALADRYEQPTQPPRSVLVKSGKIASPLFELKRRAWLKVKLVLKDNQQSGQARTLEKADVTVAGPGSSGPSRDPVATEPSTAIADIGWVAPGDYTATVALSSADGKRFVTLDEEARIAIAARNDFAAQEFPVAVVPLNIVTAQVAIDEPDLIIDHGPESYDSTIACVTLSLAQTNPDLRYDKALTFRCASATDVEAFFDDACSVDQKLGSGGALDAGVALPTPQADELRGGRTVKVYLRGKSTAGRLALSLQPADPASRLVVLGDAPPPVDAEIQVLARPHVTIQWLHDDSGVDGAKVSLDGLGMVHALPDTMGGGFGKWAGAGVKPGKYDCTVTLPDGHTYLLHDDGGTPILAPSVKLDPGGAPVTFKIRKLDIKLGATCETAGKTEGLDAEVKVKLLGAPVKLTKAGGVVTTGLPMTQVDQKLEIESFTPDGADIYEMVIVESK